MVRAPCCEKIGLKKGPWSPGEDQVLISYIQRNGRCNWRALPKKAGLLRCGKSCRLRWLNYLSPEIKRGNFTKEEEDSIIQLREMLGNKWSAIAARLPGRTDNEIKNVWHTHLKKRLPDYQPPKTTKRHSKTVFKSSGFEAAWNPDPTTSQLQHSNITTIQHANSSTHVPTSPQQTSSDMSSVTDSWAMTDTITIMEDPTIIKLENGDSVEDFLQIDESFWTEVPSFPSVAAEEVQFESPISSLANCMEQSGNMMYSSRMEDDTDFWYNLFMRAGDSSELAEF